jgi:hypothetical protein
MLEHVGERGARRVRAAAGIDRVRLADDEPHHRRDDQAGDADDHEDGTPVGVLQQLGGDDRAEGEPEQRNHALEHAVVQAAARRVRRLDGDGDASRGDRSFGQAHHRTDDQQADEAGGEPAQRRQQREGDDRRHQHLAAAEPIGRVAHDEGGHAPGDGEDTGERPELQLAQAELTHHAGKEHRQDETIEADQAERQAEDRDDLELVGGIPLFRCRCSHVPPWKLVLVLALGAGGGVRLIQALTPSCRMEKLHGGGDAAMPLKLAAGPPIQ